VFGFERCQRPPLQDFIDCLQRIPSALLFAEPRGWWVFLSACTR
jgi:hypothetical protein